ncbi:cytochrome P450 [Lentzea sp. PSKA42]|uniref:Cytochrome P450 n=1 Tax=Lentzea indica TaxID=2604800 RepID=A0ABX1FIQ4_9PSEU|nr:cytochrome P450 [Lentzea indica]NKE58810.1 cytochrome P450 [Lentzea indica]
MDIDLTDGQLFARNEFWAALAHLRRHDPVHWHPDDDGGFWVVTRYDDVVGVYSDPDSYSSRYGMRLGGNPDAVAAVAQRMLIVSDPPDHTHLKRVFAKSFTTAEMHRVDGLVRRVVRDVLADAVEVGELDFLDVAKKIPNHVVCALMDVPRSDWEWIGQVTTDAFEGADEATRAGAHSEIFLFFTELLAERRARPGDDFVSRIALDRRATDDPAGGRPLSDEEIVFNCNGVLAGANETTRYSAAGAVLALAENPDQWAVLRAGGAQAAPTAVEEVLRWTVPGVHALRTVVRATTVGGVHIGVGERVTVWNASANRDEAVFDEADRFRVGRAANRHITFGAGRHLCLGSRLARLELTVFLEELVARVRGFELVAEPTYNASNFTWGLRNLPVRLLAA